MDDTKPGCEERVCDIMSTDDIRDPQCAALDAGVAVVKALLDDDRSTKRNKKPLEVRGGSFEVQSTLVNIGWSVQSFLPDTSESR